LFFRFVSFSPMFSFDWVIVLVFVLVLLWLLRGRAGE